jgi:putative PIN family toxin of toxin-antitoxin system
MNVRTVIDTNVVVSGLRSSRGASFRVLELIGTPAFEVSLSVPLVLEYEDVLKREGGALGLADREVDAFISYWCSVAQLQEIHFLWRPVLRDPKDDHVLELAVAAGCGVIVTHNVSDFEPSVTWGVEAVRPGEFLRRIGVTS